MVSFGPCRKLPGIFSYRIITAEEFPRAHARMRVVRIPKDRVKYFLTSRLFVSLFVSSENEIACVLNRY